MFIGLGGRIVVPRSLDGATRACVGKVVAMGPAVVDTLGVGSVFLTVWLFGTALFLAALRRLVTGISGRLEGCNDFCRSCINGCSGW